MWCECVGLREGEGEGMGDPGQVPTEKGQVCEFLLSVLHVADTFMHAVMRSCTRETMGEVACAAYG